MKRWKTWGQLVLAVAWLQHGVATAQTGAAASDCPFPENPSQQAPAWVCEPESVPGFRNSALGTYQKSAAGYQFSLDQATAAARAALAAQVKALAGSQIRRVVAAAGTPSLNEAVSQFASTVTEQISAETLLGSRIVKRTVDAKGNVYVLVGMDTDSTSRQLQQAVQTAMARKPAEFQQIKGNKTDQAFVAEISKVGDV